MPKSFKARKGPAVEAAKPRSRPLSKRKRTDVEIDELDTKIAELDIKPTIDTFDDLPFSAPTKAGLKKAFYRIPTDIQARVIPAALKGRDILGAARTGSGKTLAFVLPVLENLYRRKWIGPDAGVGALIIAPTRELATQIFSVLRQVGGSGHLFAAGLLIGGKNLKDEQDAVSRMNILVGTPGRILQHLSQTVGFSLDSLQMLVLDEADRILDMGFQREVDAVIDYLPPGRQTMLFSATQTRKVSDLARLSLRDPEYISVHEGAESATPEKLTQNYVVVSLPEKLDTLWSFLQSCKKEKLIVFFSSGKQVRFVYEAFCKMQPGIPLLHLHGRQKQTARLDITTKFGRMRHCCLFATDVAARGLDFPTVDWVVQVDCPEDADTYIHRVGRTARYEKSGKAILFLVPSEEAGMLARLVAKKVPIEKTGIKQNQMATVRTQLVNLCLKDAALKYLGQKAFSCYVRSVFVQKDTEIFDLAKLPLDEYASSLGLPGAPKIKFIKGDDMKAIKNAPRQLRDLDSDSDDGEKDDEDGGDKKNKKDKEKVRTKLDRMFERRNQDLLATHRTEMIDASGELGDEVVSDGTDDDGDFMPATRRIGVDESLDDKFDMSAVDASMADTTRTKTVTLPDKSTLIVDSRRREKMLSSRKQVAKLQSRGDHVRFDEDGEAISAYAFAPEDSVQVGDRADFVKEEREKVKISDNQDRQVAREKRREKRIRRKQRERDEREPTMGSDDGGDDSDGGDDLAGGQFEEHVPILDDADFETLRPHRSRADKTSRDDDDSGSDVGRESKRKSKRARREGNEPVATLADLEALAEGLL